MINFKAFTDNLHYMVIGMLGIFIVMGVIFFVTILLNKFAGINKNQ